MLQVRGQTLRLPRLLHRRHRYPDLTCKVIQQTPIAGRKTLAGRTRRHLQESDRLLLIEQGEIHQGISGPRPHMAAGSR